jgi:hypothetical protein
MPKYTVFFALSNNSVVIEADNPDDAVAASEDAAYASVYVEAVEEMDSEEDS